MRNLKLTIEYDGAAYCGWQVQANGLTVQEVLQKALSKMTGKPALRQAQGAALRQAQGAALRQAHGAITLIGAGRTDAGVHAFGQVANFKTESKIPCNGFLKGLNSMLPKDISIKSVEEVPEGFHAKKSAKGKHYRYLISTGEARSALLNNRAWHLPDKRFILRASQPEADESRSSRLRSNSRGLDIRKMQAEANVLVGTHDFSAFCAAGDCNKSKVRRIDKIVVKKAAGDEELISIDVFGGGFLKYMIRNIVGTLVGIVQRSKFKDCSKVLESRDRKKAGVTAPACGLYLVKVIY